MKASVNHKDAMGSRMDTTGEQRGAESDCKSDETGSTPALVSTKYAPLSQMHWYWRWVYWPCRQAFFAWIEYPLIKRTNAFLEPVYEAQRQLRAAIYERDTWKAKCIEASKELARLKRKGGKE